MVTSALLELTLGVAFYVLPAVTLLFTVIFLFARRRRVRRSPTIAEHEGSWEIVKDPVMVASVLAVSGVVAVAFITGGLAWTEYSEVPASTARIFWDGVTDWSEVGSSEAISLKGGIVIATACMLVYCASLVGYYRRRLDENATRDATSPRDD